MAAPPKGPADYYAPGDFNATCSMCGRKRKASQLVKNWMGQYRCTEHNEPRQPQDFVRAIPDITSTTFVQPELKAFIFTCSINTQAAIADYGTADCMRADNDHYDPYGI